jgi:NAD(P)-dependent dehydrogenase (short-subunit alcohol dehydrogenase family)
LGAAFAAHLAQCGAAVLVNDIDEEPAAGVARAIRAAGGRAFEACWDLAAPGAAPALVSACRKAFGRLDGVINNAAVHHIAPLIDDDPARVRRLLDVNLIGAINLTAAAVASMEGGSIINITSMAALGLPGRGAYAASKAALLALTYCWALELEARGIRVNAIAPRAATRLTKETEGRLESAEEIAPLASFLMSDLSLGVTGQCVRADGHALSWVRPPWQGPFATRRGERISDVSAALKQAGPLPPSGFFAVQDAQLGQST